ncbi:MAG: DUF86 domain-containing protein [Patescibacteria group bacterium]|nr:DUF86 domain-containing protein [Patescibacteria group bacterium]
MDKTPKFFLQHILESIGWIEKEVEDLTEEEFLKNVPIQDAVVRRFEIIGETVRNLPDEYKENHSEIEWHKAMAMRNLLIHGYFGVDFKIVWDTAKQTLPEFKKQIEHLLDTA